MAVRLVSRVREVLSAELGLGQDEIAALREAGAIR